MTAGGPLEGPGVRHVRNHIAPQQPPPLAKQRRQRSGYPGSGTMERRAYGDGSRFVDDDRVKRAPCPRLSTAAQKGVSAQRGKECTFCGLMLPTLVGTVPRVVVKVETEVVVTVAFTGTAWELRAACRGAESGWFVPPIAGESSSQRRLREATAKSICGRCPVRQECLEYALRVEEPFGIWGGLTEAERRELHSTIAR